MESRGSDDQPTERRSTQQPQGGKNSNGNEPSTAQNNGLIVRYGMSQAYRMVEKGYWYRWPGRLPRWLRFLHRFGLGKRYLLVGIEPIDDPEIVRVPPLKTVESWINKVDEG